MFERNHAIDSTVCCLQAVGTVATVRTGYIDEQKYVYILFMITDEEQCPKRLFKIQILKLLRNVFPLLGVSDRSQQKYIIKYKKKAETTEQTFFPENHQ